MNELDRRARRDLRRDEKVPADQLQRLAVDQIEELIPLGPTVAAPA